MAKRTASQIGKSNVNRGKSHERKVASLLSDWSGYSFRRRRVEGRDEATIGRDLTGDVIAVDYSFLFIVEVKCGKGFSLDAILNNPQTALFSQWWSQNNYDCQIAQQITGQEFFPMVFFKPHINLDWIGISSRAFSHFIPKIDINKLEYLTYNYKGISVPYNATGNKKNPTYIDVKLDDVIFLRWKNFADIISTTGLFRPKNQK